MHAVIHPASQAVHHLYQPNPQSAVRAWFPRPWEFLELAMICQPIPCQELQWSWLRVARNNPIRVTESPRELLCSILR